MRREKAGREIHYARTETDSQSTARPRPRVHEGRYIDMRVTCDHAKSMERMIQVRNVPDALHRGLKARAAMAGMSLSDYLLGELREIAERPTLAEFRARLHTRTRFFGDLDTGGLVREERPAR